MARRGVAVACRDTPWHGLRCSCGTAGHAIESRDTASRDMKRSGSRVTWHHMSVPGKAYRDMDATWHGMLYVHDTAKTSRDMASSELTSDDVIWHAMNRHGVA